MIKAEEAVAVFTPGMYSWVPRSRVGGVGRDDDAYAGVGKEERFSQAGDLGRP